jgi:hypothetical protein
LLKSGIGMLLIALILQGIRVSAPGLMNFCGYDIVRIDAEFGRTKSGQGGSDSSLLMPIGGPEKWLCTFNRK